jgi:shikimate dehydrogenase
MIEKQYGIIGKPLSHSQSPTLHNFWFNKYKINAHYSLIEIDESQVESIINKIRKKELEGINVTTPYKQAVIPFLDTIINEAKETYSVNTIYLNKDNKVIGENTDVFGFNKAFIDQIKKVNLTNKKALVLGAGGVTPSVVYCLCKANVNQIFISNKTMQKAENIKKNFSSIDVVPWESVSDVVKNMDIIINTTSLGMKGGNDFEKEFRKIKFGAIYYDVIYNPLETRMIKNFKKKESKTFNGLEMFMYQGQKSFFIWNKVLPKIDKEIEKKIILEIR